LEEEGKYLLMKRFDGRQWANLGQPKEGTNLREKAVSVNKFGAF
jgi:hypothetical protein